jgi:hypothetical protein
MEHEQHYRTLVKPATRAGGTHLSQPPSGFASGLKFRSRCDDDTTTNGPRRSEPILPFGRFASPMTNPKAASPDDGNEIHRDHCSDQAATDTSPEKKARPKQAQRIASVSRNSTAFGMSSVVAGRESRSSPFSFIEVTPPRSQTCPPTFGATMTPFDPCGPS